MTNRFAAVALALLLAASLSITVAGAAVGPSAAPSPPAPDRDQHDTSIDRASLSSQPTAPTLGTGPTDDGETIHRSVTLRHLSERPGEFETEIAFDVPERVTALEITLPAGASVESTNGFESSGGDVYEWRDGGEPRVTFTMPANRTGIGHHASTGTHARSAHDRGEGYSFVDTGSWGMVAVPQLRNVRWSRTGAPVSTDRTVEIDGPGATGGEIAYFGAVTEHTREARGETIRLAVPEVVAMSESTTDVLDALAHASETLRVGARNDEVFVAVAPTTVDWSARGIQYGPDDAWVRADARLDTASSVWLHEYVHTRQAFANYDGGTTPETRWLVEAQAEYYAGLLSLERGGVDYREFERAMGAGERSPYESATLAEPATWRDSRADYAKGALVFGALDRAIRLETDGAHTAETVVRELNLRDEPITESVFHEVVEDAAGASVREFATRYTRTSETPGTWSHADHRAAFDRPTAAFEYAVDGEPAVSGPSRETTLAGTTPVAGETVTFEVVAANVGDRDGSYDATLQVDGRLVDRNGGALAAGDRTTESLSWTPESAGRYEIRVGDHSRTVRVGEPAEGTVTGLEVEPTRVDVGEPVTAIATVENDAAVPAEATVAFRTPDGVADERTVSVAPGGTATVETTLSFDRDGRYGVAAGDHSRTVTVGNPSVIDGVADAVPGFGAGTALLALLVAALVLVLARRA